MFFVSKLAAMPSKMAAIQIQISVTLAKTSITLNACRAIVIAPTNAIIRSPMIFS
jgi:hypothetical protein